MRRGGAAQTPERSLCGGLLRGQSAPGKRRFLKPVSPPAVRQPRSTQTPKPPRFTSVGAPSPRTVSRWKDSVLKNPADLLVNMGKVTKPLHCLA
ncbi:hypothetical protein GN956_G13897 [Arapaima gigas]